MKSTAKASEIMKRSACAASGGGAQLHSLSPRSGKAIAVMTNINNTRSDAALLIKVLADLSREIEQRLGQGGVTEQASFAARVKSLMTDVPDLPNFSRFHAAFRDNAKAVSNEGHMRAPFFMA